MYPILHSLFQGYPDIIEPRHPLGYLVSVSDCYVTRVANRTSQAMANVLQNDPDWFADKIKFVIRTDDLPQASATLAEIRAYSDILTVWDRSLIFPQNSGPDFIIRYGTHELWIEIHTPHGCGEQDHTCRRMESSRASGISISSFEYAPYGLSQGTDATQAAEQVSQTSQAKIEKPNQFSDRYPSILWLDYCDPFIWPTEYAPGHCQPLISSWDNLLLGGIWHGFYAEEEDPIYDNINVEGYSGRPHHLQYPGHFRQNQRTDLAIINFPSSKIVFQSHVSTKTIPDDIFFDLFHLPGFVYENSWLDWPIPSFLIDRINHAKRTIPAFENFRR